MFEVLPLLEEITALLEAELVFHDAKKLDNGEWEFEVELVPEDTDTIEELTERVKLRMNKFKASAAMRKGKMKLGRKPKSRSHLTSAQKKQRKKAAQASANKRRGVKRSTRRFMWR